MAVRHGAIEPADAVAEMGQDVAWRLVVSEVTGDEEDRATFRDSLREGRETGPRWLRAGKPGMKFTMGKVLDQRAAEIVEAGGRDDASFGGCQVGPDEGQVLFGPTPEACQRSEPAGDGPARKAQPGLPGQAHRRRDETAQRAGRGPVKKVAHAPGDSGRPVPIMLSRVTSAARRSASQPSVPAGRAGITM